MGETDPLGNQTRFAYTVENLLEQVTYANGATQSLTYDLAGNVISETDGEGNTKQYQYDRVNRLTAVIDEAGKRFINWRENKMKERVVSILILLCLIFLIYVPTIAASPIQITLKSFDYSDNIFFGMDYH